VNLLIILAVIALGHYDAANAHGDVLFHLAICQMFLKVRTTRRRCKIIQGRR